MKKALFLLFAVAVFASCGTFEKKFGRLKSQTTVLNFGIARDENYFVPMVCTNFSDNAVPCTDFNGLMIYIVGAQGTNFNMAFSAPTAATYTVGQTFSLGFSVTVPNGTYKIYALAWGDGAPGKMNGNIGCGLANGGNALTFSGGDKTIPLVVSTANCGLPSTPNIFYSQNAHVTAATIGHPAVYACNGITGTPSCTAADGTMPNPSMQVRMRAYAEYEGNKTYNGAKDLVSACQNGSGSTISSWTAVPPGNPSFPKIFDTEIDIWTANNCSGAPAKKYYFPAGLTSGTTPAVATALATGAYNLFIDTANY